MEHKAVKEGLSDVRSRVREGDCVMPAATWPLISRGDEMSDKRKTRLEPEPTVCVRECEGEVTVNITLHMKRCEKL